MYTHRQGAFAVIEFLPRSFLACQDIEIVLPEFFYVYVHAD